MIRLSMNLWRWTDAYSELKTLLNNESEYTEGIMDLKQAMKHLYVIS